MSLIPAGYKQTEVGVIPQDWECRELVTEISEMTDFVAAGSFESLRNNVRVFDAPKFALYVRLYDLRLGLGHDTQKYVDKDSYQFLEKSNLFGNELLVANIGANVGETFLMPANLGAATIAPNMIVVRSNPKKLQYGFLYHYTASCFGQARMRDLIAGSGHPKINKTDLKKFKVLVPPLPEQRAIAAALSDVDALLAKLDQLIAKRRDLKQASMQQLLTAQTRLPGFSGEWEVKRLGDVCPLQRGFDLLTTQLRQGCYPVVYSNGVLNHHHEFMVKGPGVVTGRSGTIGNVHFVEKDFWPHNTSLWVTSFKGNSPKFIFYLLGSIGLERFGTGSGVPTLNRNDVHAHSVRIPPSTDEQTAIATVLSEMDAELAALEARRDKTRALKQGMMQELLTGRIRLV